MLDPRLLRSFVVLAEELHFTRASERLHLAQPALSRQIRRLEQQVGAQLVDRTSRAVGLTEAGRAMLEPARAAMQAAELAERAVREAAQATAHPLKVGVDMYIDDVVPTLATYASQHGEVSLWISRMLEMQGQEMLTAGQLDAFIGFGPPDPDGQEGKARAAEVELHALVHPDVVNAEKTAIPLSDFRRWPIATPPREQQPARFDCFMDLLSEGEGADALRLWEIEAVGPLAQAAIVEQVRSQSAVAFGPPETLAAFGEGLSALPFDPALFVWTYVSWVPGRSTLVDAFVEHYSAAQQAADRARRAVPGVLG